MVRPAVDLPQPDSPTRPIVVPRFSLKGNPVDSPHLADDLVEQAALDGEILFQVPHFQQGLVLLFQRAVFSLSLMAVTPLSSYRGSQDSGSSCTEWVSDS